MVSIDARTRLKSQTRALPAETVRREVLPALLDEHGEVAGRGAETIGAPPLTISAADEHFVLVCASGRMVLLDGSHESGIAVKVDEDALSDVIQDLSTLSWCRMFSRLSVQRGNSDDLARWDPVLRALRDGVPVSEPGTIKLAWPDGTPLDPQRSFVLEDDPALMGAFLQEAGYLHVRGVFTPEEMDAVSAELDQAIAGAERDDRESWWARTDEGWYPARILGFNRKSPALRALLRSHRFQQLKNLVDDDLVQGDIDNENMASGLLKKIGVQEGISDVRWHTDCSPGGHTFECAGLNVGIQLTAADVDTGELGVMAGSNRANIPGIAPVMDFGLTRQPMTTAKGDVTIHCTCTMHMSRPPVRGERRVVYTSLSLGPFPEDMSSLPPETTRRARQASLQDVVGRGADLKRKSAGGQGYSFD